MGTEAKERGCDYLERGMGGVVKDRMWATKGEFFELTSFQSTICAWTAAEFEQGSQTKHRYRDVHAGFTEIHRIRRKNQEYALLKKMTELNKVVDKALL